MRKMNIIKSMVNGSVFGIANVIVEMKMIEIIMQQ